MRAKLLTKVKIMKDEKVVDCNFTKGKIYEIKNTDFFFYYIYNDLGVLCRLSRSLFEIVEEDKVEQVKIVRKFNDLIGLENGTGLYIDENTDVILRSNADGKLLVVNRVEYFGCDLEVYLETLKAMGFEFQYKPLRTVEEIKNEIDSLKSIRFVLGEPNWFLSYDGEKNVYTTTYATKYCSVCEKYMEKEKAQAYADELNEIIGADKNGL